MTIALTGFMGCGKSSVGRKLSELLCCPFMDLDEIIEERAGKDIPEIFADEGEAAFRKMEHEALEHIFNTQDTRQSALYPESEVTAVLAPGGGTVMRKECAEMLKDNTLCIYLRASVETLVRNLENESEGRPMLVSDKPLHERIRVLLDLRSSTYEATAHVIIDTDGRSIDDVAAAIISQAHLRGA